MGNFTQPNFNMPQPGGQFQAPQPDGQQHDQNWQGQQHDQQHDQNCQGQQSQQQAPVRVVEQAATKSTSFIAGAFSDSGEPSSSRVITGVLSLAVIAIVSGVFWHICHLKDNAALGLWLSALPMMIASLIALMSAPYTINRSSTALTQVVDSISRRPQQ